MIASWNDMIWECTPSCITRPEGIQSARAIKSETNDDKKGKTPTENVGFNDEEVTLSTTYRVETGTRDIRGVYEKWRGLVGKAAPLVIGSAIFGPDKMQLQSVSISNISTRADGTFMAATLSFKFVEFVEAVAVKTTANNKNGTAVNVTASASDKQIKKPGALKDTDTPMKRAIK